MPLDAAAIERGCRGADVVTGRYLCRAEVERFRKLAQGGGDIVVGCTQEAPLFAELAGEGAALSFANMRETAGWSKDAAKAGPKMAALIAAAAEPLPAGAVRQPQQRRRRAGLWPRREGDRGGEPAQGSSRRHRADHQARRPHAAARHRVSGGQGHHQIGEGPSRRVRARGRRLRRACPVVARRAELRHAARRRGVEMRHRARSVRRRGAVSGARSARRLSARRSRRSRRGAARGAQGARPRRHLRQAALHHLHRGSLRAFALAHRRLPPLPRPLPDRRDHAGRRARCDRRAGLRRLRPVRRGLPDRRRGLRAAAGRRADAQAARRCCRPIARPAGTIRSSCCTTRITAPS